MTLKRILRAPLCVVPKVGVVQGQLNKGFCGISADVIVIPGNQVTRCYTRREKDRVPAVVYSLLSLGFDAQGSLVGIVGGIVVTE